MHPSFNLLRQDGPQPPLGGVGVKGRLKSGLQSTGWLVSVFSAARKPIWPPQSTAPGLVDFFVEV